VLHEGSLVATLTTAGTTQEEILTYAAGIATSNNKGDARMSDQKPTQTREQS